MSALRVRARIGSCVLALWAAVAAAPTGGEGQAAAPAAPPVARPTATQVDLRAVTTTLEREIHRAMVEGQIPSLTIALVAGGEVIWSQGYGESNLRARTPATPSTVYMIASTFKTMSMTALLMLMEEGHFDLDDPVRDYLNGQSIRRESRRNPVTFRHLLTHTSGLPTIFSPLPVWADSVPPKLDVYLKENLVVLGPPLERVRYSNLAFSLVAHLVEEISGQDFRDFMHENLFLPLGMTSTAFSPTPDMEERLSTPYVPDRETNRLMPVSRLRFAEWPAGGVWGTVEDQARWLAANLNGGVYDGYRILQEETLKQAHGPQYRDFTGAMAGGWGDGKAAYGLAWWTTTHGGERYIAHSGSVQGYTAFLHGNVDSGLGVAILTNGNRAHSHLTRLSFLATDLMAGQRLP